MENNPSKIVSSDWSTRDVAKVLGLAVRSVQLMVDRGELDAWKTPGGHRRIARASVERWLGARRGVAPALREPGGVTVDESAAEGAAARVTPGDARQKPVRRPQRVLLIEDSIHFQNLVRLLIAHELPDVELHVAEDGIVGLALAGELQPDVLIVDILLPGIDGATLIARMRSHPQFQRSRLIVLTSLDETQRGPYAFALEGLPVVHKPRLVQELPALLAAALEKVE